MSDEARINAVVSLVRIATYAADLECWYRLPWYQRLVTPKPKMPEDGHDR